MRFRFLVRPGWLALTLAVFVFAGACFTLLAPWQFSRNDERKAQNSAVLNSRTTAPVPIEQLLPSRDEPNSGAEWRQVSLTGSYRQDAEALARLRTVQGEAAYEVLTPFTLTSGDTVLVDRGYVRLKDNKVEPYGAAPAGEVTVTARVRRDEQETRPAFTEAGHRQVYGINADIVGKAASLDIRPGYFQLNASQPGVTNELPEPQLDSGPFFSYALQWIAFGAMALLGWLYFTVREARPGGALTEERPKRKSVAEMLAEDEEESHRV
ncbi:SURF1 family protein [Solihabitans fulvus]|uniref:SURF1-like protein n=1 Tax=Solihabitans fulvus TaxID=1892852 RepID=A0A5B2XLN8_9PSEU|nr:SURF1 family cytochrome oxidase biogenesis protein [Solihabitans fulvus]KAA2263829.1 SURF1 family protein [Solihabitans fulvus]